MKEELETGSLYNVIPVLLIIGLIAYIFFPFSLENMPWGKEERIVRIVRFSVVPEGECNLLTFYSPYSLQEGQTDEEYLALAESLNETNIERYDSCLEDMDNTQKEWCAKQKYTTYDEYRRCERLQDKE